MKAVAACMALWMLSSAFAGDAGIAPCGKDWIGWKKYPSVSQKKEVHGSMDPPREYHLILIEADSSGNFTIAELPMYIREQRRDTVYGASYGSSYHGTGSCRQIGPALSLSGTYASTQHFVLKADTGFRYDLTLKNGGYADAKTGIPFFPASESEIAAWKAKWESSARKGILK